jgi:hypothetical protein
MLILTTIWNFLKNPKNRTIILFIFIAALIALFFWQRSRTEHFKFKYETEVFENKRKDNNIAALNATIKTYKDKNGNLTGEILGFQLKVDELDGLYKKYFSLYQKEKGKEIKTIIQTVYVVKNNFNTPTITSDSTIIYNDSINYGGNNWTIIEGKIPYSISQHIKKGENFNYAFNSAVLYCYSMQLRGMKDAKVTSFNNNGKEINIDSKDTSSMFRVFLMSSISPDEKSNISYLTGLSEDYIDLKLNQGLWYYYTGMFIPNKDQNIVEDKELLTYSKLYTGNNNLVVKDAMTLYTGLYKDTKTGKIMIQVKTDHPNVTFIDIRGAEILSEDNNRKESRSMRKPFGIGLNLGIGGMLTPVNNNWTIKYGPVISVGLNWSPRFLQFGPSKKLTDIINQ